MKRRYLIAILIVVVAAIGIYTYRVDMPPFGGRKIMTKPYKWSFTGASFVTTFSDKKSPVQEAKTTHSCLAGNDESCFTFSVRSGNYASYFNAYRIAMYDEMKAMSGSTVTDDDMKAQLKAGFHELKTIPGNNDTTRHLVDIGMEGQHLYVERPWGTLIVEDMLGLKGPSYEDRTYMNYTDIPQHLIVQ